MKNKGKMLVLYNGYENSDPASADFISEAAVGEMASSVNETLVSAGYDSELFVLSDPSADIRKIEKLQPCLIFNLCEGFSGKSAFEMNVAALWELLGIPFTGNSALTLGIARSKALSKAVFRAAGIPTPDYVLLDSAPEKVDLKFPMIVKPSAEDASLGIRPDSVVSNIRDLRKKVSDIIEEYSQAALVEEYIPGREFNVAILDGAPQPVLPVSEIDFSQIGIEFPHITSYEAKWMKDHPLYEKTPSVCPASLDEKLEAKIRDIALHVFHAVSGKDYGRIDLRVDREGNIFVLEYNPNPDISLDAGYAKALKAGRISYLAFLEILIKNNTMAGPDDDKKNAV